MRATRTERAGKAAREAALLPALGLQPAIGRNFSPAEDSPAGPHVVLIGHALIR